MNVKKICISLISAILIGLTLYSTNVYAISDIIGYGENFVEAGENNAIDKTKLKKTSSYVYKVLLGCGIAAAVIVGAILGIIFILSSAEGKAKISEALIPYIIGCFIVFGAFTIWSIAINMGENVAKGI